MKRSRFFSISLAGVRIFIFLLIGAVLFSALSEVLRRKTMGVIDMVHSLYAVEEDQVDLLVLGSSHGYASFDSNYIWGEYGITSYCMCSQAQSVATSYYLLKEALEYQSPKVVLLESYTFCDDKLYRSLSAVRSAFDGVRLGTAKMEMIDDFLSEASFAKKLTYYLPFIKYHSRWSELSDHDIHVKSYLHGSKLSKTVITNEAPEIPKGTREPGETSFAYFEKIADLCEQNNIDLVVYAAPFNCETTEKYKIRQKTNNALEILLEEMGIPFLYYQKTGEADIDWSADFRDVQHMNSYGALKITKCIGEYMVEQYHLPDHRQDENYESWQEDYLLYQQDLNGLVGDIDNGVDEES